jgi:hypothetical protein
MNLKILEGSDRGRFCGSNPLLTIRPVDKKNKMAMSVVIITMT